jgi:hypothetical protein
MHISQEYDAAPELGRCEVTIEAERCLRSVSRSGSDQPRLLERRRADVDLAFTGSELRYSVPIMKSAPDWHAAYLMHTRGIQEIVSHYSQL